MSSWIAKRYRFEKELDKLNEGNRAESSSLLDLSNVATYNYRTARYLAGKKPRDQYDEMITGCAILMGLGFIGAITGGVLSYVYSKDNSALTTVGGSIAGGIGLDGLLVTGESIKTKIEDKIYNSVMRKHNNKRQ